MDQQNKPRPSMGDIRPSRSMDMRRPAGVSSQPSAPVARPAAPAQPIARPQRPQPLPAQPVQRPVPRMPQRPLAAAVAPAAVKAETAAPRIRKSNPFWRGLLQVVVSLLVIVGVAAVIVALYLRYYQ